MAIETPEATAEAVSASAGGLADGLDTILVMFCSSAGPLNAPRFIGGGKTWLSTFAFGDGSEFACHYFKRARKMICGIRMPSTVPGSIEGVDTDGVTGTALINVTGVPHRAYELQVEYTNGGIVGADGIEFRYSINGGLNFSASMRLGTSSSFVIPNTGLTLVHSAGGTITLGSVVKAWCVAPKWSTSDFEAAFEQAKALDAGFRCLVLIGDFNKVEADALQAKVDDLYASNKRPLVFISARDWRRDARFTLQHGKTIGSSTATGDLVFAAAGDTITRSVGSWLDDGFAVGEAVTPAGSVSNNGAKGIISALTATVMTLPASPGLANETVTNGIGVTIAGIGPTDLDFTGSTIVRSTGSWIKDGFKAGVVPAVAGSTSNNGELSPVVSATDSTLTLTSAVVTEMNVNASLGAISITGDESESAWATAILANLGPFEDQLGRIAIGAGMTRMTSEIHQVQMRAPVMWAAVERYMQHDVQISVNRTSDGKLIDHSIKDAENVVVEHDSRVLSVLNAAGFLTARTFVRKDGCYINTPNMKAPAGSAFAIMPWRAVASLACDIVQQVTETFIGGNPELKQDGTLTDEERDRYNKIVNAQLTAELLSRKREGARASRVTWEADPEDRFDVLNSLMNGDGEIKTLGLVGSVHTVFRVNPAT